MARSLNKAQLIGNLTRDPELRYTPQGTAVCSFGLATNRRWKTDSGEMRDEADFHRIVAWDKLAEICAQLLKKGSKTYVEGRLQTRNWESQDGAKRTTTEIVVSDMILLDSRGAPAPATGEVGFDVPNDFDEVEKPKSKTKPKTESKPKSKTTTKKSKKTKTKKVTKKTLVKEDIPF